MPAFLFFLAGFIGGALIVSGSTLLIFGYPLIWSIIIFCASVLIFLGAGVMALS